MISEKESRFLLVGAVVLIIFGAFFYGIMGIFSPFILALILIGFLIPFREHKSIRVLIALIFTLFMLWLFDVLQDIISPFVIAFALAYLFDPVVDIFERRKISRTTSIAIIVTLLIGVFTLFGFLVVPQVTAEFQVLAGSIPSVDALRESVRLNWFSFLERMGVDVDQMLRIIQTELTQKVNDFVRYFSESAQVVTSGLSSLVTQLINLIIVPFVMFYFLRDFDRNMTTLRARIPERHRERFEKTYDRVNTILSLYIRGKLLAATAIMIITWLVLVIFGVRFALLIGLMSGFLSLLPYVGSVFTFVLVIVLGLFNPDPGRAILISVIVVGIVQVLDMLIISPKVVGEKLGLHPVLMIFSLFVFAKIWGIVGLLISIPLTAILRVFIAEWYDQSFFRQEFLRDEKED